MIVSTSLDWTLVRPPRLTGEQRTGRYRTCEGHLPLFGFTISRADFMIKSAEGHFASRKIMGSAIERMISQSLDLCRR